MMQIKRVTLILLFTATIPLHAQTITNLSVAQRTDGSGLVDVYYTLAGTAATYYISMEASFNNGSTFSPVAANYLSGHIGAVAPGSGRHLVWNGKGSNNNTFSTQTKVKLTLATSAPCGQPLTITHVAGAVAPVNKTTTYGTLTGIPGEPAKCWITSNLGSDHQATAVNDATEASAGWYWQFNRKQGYKHDGTNRTPNITWYSNITGSSGWIAGNDPCSLELGTAWRIPTSTEWIMIDNAGGWTNWNGPWDSGLKLHAAGGLDYTNGTLINRGMTGYYWSKNNMGLYSGYVFTFNSNNSVIPYYNKSYGFNIRCIRD